MRRRALFAGLLSAVALPLPLALAQPPALPSGPSGGEMGAGRQNGAAPRQRAKLGDLGYDQMSQRQRQQVARALAGQGAAPLSPEETARRWDAMDPRQRRQVARSAKKGRQRARPPRGDAAGGDGGMRGGGMRGGGARGGRADDSAGSGSVSPLSPPRQ